MLCSKMARSHARPETLQNQYDELFVTFEMMRGAEVLRSGIKFGEDVWCDGFVKDMTQLKGKTRPDKRHEIRRQKWVHILLKSSDTNVAFLRQLVLYDALNNTFLKEFQDDLSKSAKESSVHDLFTELNQLKRKYLEENFSKDEFVASLLKYLDDPLSPPSNATLITFYIKAFETFAKTVAEIYSIVVNKIHSARFVLCDYFPAEYNLLQTSGMKNCGNMILSVCVTKRAQGVSISESKQRLVNCEENSCDSCRENSALQNQYDELFKTLNEMKRAEFIRSGIEFGEFWCPEFIEDKEQLRYKTPPERKQEILRQLWLHILLKSSLDKAYFLRQLILYDALKSDYLKKFESNLSKSAKESSASELFTKLNRLRKEYLKENFSKDEFIGALIEFIDKPWRPSNNTTFTKFRQQAYETFAKTVAKIHSTVTNRIHAARFDFSFDLPSEYDELRTPNFNDVGNMILSIFTSYPAT